MENLSLLGVLVNWFPMILLIAALFYFLGGGRHGMSQGRYMKECLEETRRQNKILERIARALEERADNSS